MAFLQVKNLTKFFGDLQVLKGVDFTEELSMVTGLEVKFTAIRRDLIDEELKKIKNILPIDPIKYGDWL